MSKGADFITMNEAKRIARAEGFREGETVSEFDIIKIITAAFISGYSAALQKAKENAKPI